MLPRKYQEEIPTWSETLTELIIGCVVMLELCALVWVAFAFFGSWTP